MFPAVYALVGMGAVLGAVVHAPLAAILILLELTSDYHIVLPAMLATIVATGVARFIYPESVYTIAVKAHGIRLGSARDLSLLRRTSIEQVGLQPALLFGREMPLAQLVKAMGDELRDAVIVDEGGFYYGILRHEDVEAALFNPDSMPLLVAGELARRDIPMLCTLDNLGQAIELLSATQVGTLAIALPHSASKVVGVVSQQYLLRRYQEMLSRE